eukprot:TRINITY_DN15473_c0_g1_i1.p1 TRINITY_DN15473_c0_g1~~TRINITY_DN15473_c0_g1_i1.p1  ORF type:complete len:196 (+),score=55.94 TRINITY_DN15473_c0_g1_i1:130-717(+)
MKREHQCATIQLDFQLPMRFNLMYKAQEGMSDPELGAGMARPVMVHRAMLGSVERMMAVLIEHFQGRWPYWLSPRQAMVVPVHHDHNDYAEQVVSFLREGGFYVDADLGPDTMNKKIMSATKAEYNFVLVVGGTEEEERAVTVRTRTQGANEWDKGTISLEECGQFFKMISDTYARTPAADPAVAAPKGGKGKAK